LNRVGQEPASFSRCRSRKTAGVQAAAERKASNESTFRLANEKLEERATAMVGREDASPIPFLCECPRQDCTQVVLVTLAEYESVRAEPRRGLAVPGHEDYEIECVIERNERFAVTEKFGRAGEVQERLDPRT
jgi:hypothetical protein